MLALKSHLAAEGIQFGFARVPWETKADFNRHHVTEAIGPEMIFVRLHDALDAYKKSSEAGKGVSGRRAEKLADAALFQLRRGRQSMALHDGGDCSLVGWAARSGFEHSGDFTEEFRGQNTWSDDCERL